MQHRDTFSSCHPLVNFLYYAVVLVVTMFCTHPVLQGISLVGSLFYLIMLRGRKGLRLTFGVALPMLLLTMLVNPAFNHQGITILTYLPSGNPLTVESILYGISAGAMLASVLCWFATYTEVITSDKFVYLFGRVIPSLSLVLSMTLRFVPKFKAQLLVVSEAQRCVGRDASSGPLLRRIRNAVTIFSILMTWALENAIETADSMKSRGYGLPGRSAFSIYRLDDRDRLLLAWIGFSGSFLGCGALAGGFSWRYYPTIKGAALTPLTGLMLLCWLLLCITPPLLDLCADYLWNRRKELT